MAITVVWFRRDLRLADNPGLAAGVVRGAVVALFVLDPRLLTRHSPRREAWLLANLAALDASLRQAGTRLLLRHGDPRDEVLRVAREAKAWTAVPGAAPAAAPAHIAAPAQLPGVELPAGEGRALPAPGEAAARAALESFVRDRLARYGDGRDRLDIAGTSRLSYYTRFGLISPRQIQTAVRTGLAAWQEGRTGYPVVDAGMRELAATGFMHDRARLVTASFLTKHLLIDWREGERWFMRHLLDGDPAVNVGNWQWVASTGADAMPAFRIFNPAVQGARFDPTGAYVRRWVPELAAVPTSDIHTPGRLRGVPGYAAPIVVHEEARARALAALARATRGFAASAPSDVGGDRPGRRGRPREGGERGGG